MAAKLLCLHRHNQSPRNFCPPVWSWRTSHMQNPSPAGQKHEANYPSSEWELYLSTPCPCWGENEKISAHLTWIFFTSHLLSFKCTENLHFTVYTYFNISFFPWNHQINVTLLAIRHAHTVTLLLLHAHSGGHHCQLEKHNTRGPWYFQKAEVGEVSSLSTLTSLWPDRVIFLQQNVWRVTLDDNSSYQPHHSFKPRLLHSFPFSKLVGFGN